ncbi:hypothetical protein D3C81_2132820 [compost metagenome]
MQAAGLEVEPLEMVAFGIGADRQQGLERVADIDYLDIAAVEVGTDVERRFSHGHNRVLEYDFYGGYFTRKSGVKPRGIAGCEGGGVLLDAAAA